MLLLLMVTFMLSDRSRTVVPRLFMEPNRPTRLWATSDCGGDRRVSHSKHEP